MYLSMYLIADWLEAYRPYCQIKDGAMILQNARILSESGRFRPDSVYIGKAKEFIPTIKESVICVNGGDYLIIHNSDPDLIFNEVLDAFEFYNGWEHEIKQKIFSGCSIQDLIDCSEDVFKNPIAVVNSSHMVQGISSGKYAGHAMDNIQYLRENKFMPLDIIMEFNRLLKGTMESKEPYYFKSPALNFQTVQQNVFYDQKHIGWMLISINNPRFGRCLSQLCNEFVGKLTLWKSMSRDPDAFSPQSDLFIRILDGRETGSPDLLNQLHCLGWSDADEKYLIQIETPEEERFLYRILIYQYSQTFTDCYIFPYKTFLLIVFNAKNNPPEHLLGEIDPILEQSRASYGVSYPFQDVFQLRQSLSQAGIALFYGRRNGRRKNRCEDYAVLYAIHVLKEHLETDISHPAIHKIREYDAANGTEYEKTLMVYLQNERNQTRSAELLHIHKNTLLYRIDRLENVFGLQLNDHRLREHLLISMMLKEA